MKKYDKVMMETAFNFSILSKCNRLKVGAVLARDGRILVTGYNGTIAGTPNACEVIDEENSKFHYTVMDEDTVPDFLETYKSLQFFRPEFLKYIIIRKLNNRLVEVKYPLELALKTSPFTVHAEQNILIYAAREGISTKDTTLYITHSPCAMCAKLIASAGIKRVVYGEEYRDDGGLNFLRNLAQYGINIEVEKYKGVKDV